MTKPRVPGVPNRRYQRRTHSRPSPGRSLLLSLLLCFLYFSRSHIQKQTTRERRAPHDHTPHGGHTTLLLQTRRWPHSNYSPPHWVTPHAKAPPRSHLGWNSIITHLIRTIAYRRCAGRTLPPPPRHRRALPAGPGAQTGPV